MHLLPSFLTTLLITGTLAVPSTGPRAATIARAAQAVQPGNGTNGGFYYYFWSDRAGPVTYNNLEGGRYTVQWGNDTHKSGSFFAGKGWGFESADNLKTVVYKGTWSTTGTGYVSLYGWMDGSRLEYYIVEDFGTFDPSTGLEKRASVTSDGGVYDVYIRRIVGPGLYQGIRTQVWSIRRTRRTEGTITPKDHFDAWQKLNVPLGKHDFAILATEGYFSSGEADITVGERST
ncbi:putative endo-1,4-beta-xylanase B [Madurella mycetomatis]|uniref:Endo-1,4-beta-xylanase n=1 Tax=Madurella mycetomatis TaxID=100816 RepID=A0A175W9J3_9PEZI|nr:putative endo-1,4-beta-xylanase B [Madurella mycetomatis]